MFEQNNKDFFMKTWDKNVFSYKNRAVIGYIRNVQHPKIGI